MLTWATTGICRREAGPKRVSAMALRVLDYLGAKNLEGRTNALKRGSVSLGQIITEAKFPAEFKHITVQELLAGRAVRIRGS